VWCLTVILKPYAQKYIRFNNCSILLHFNLQLKRSLYKPWEFQEVKASRFQENLHMKVVRLPAPSTGRHYPQEISHVLFSVTGWVDPRTTVQSEGLYQWKFPVTPSGIETATFWLVTRCLNQLRHRHFTLKVNTTSASTVFVRSFLSPVHAVTIHLLKTNLMSKHILMSQLDSSHHCFLHLSSITCKLP
jgi:hypothetical protein